MACPDNNPCSPKDPCGDLYQDCGCEFPSTFGCVTNESALPNIGSSANENGKDILTKIDAKLANIGKVKIDGSDSCPEFLSDKIGAGSNITFTFTGEGCDRQMLIHATEGGVPVDISAKVSSSDNTAGFLNSKIKGGTFINSTILNPGNNEQLRFDVVPLQLISNDVGNLIVLGSDGKLKTSYTLPTGAETKIIQGVGTQVSGTGTPVDPYIVSTNASIQIARPCFDGIWRDVTLLPTGNTNVVYVTGTPQFRYRYDGSIEFKGQATYTVAFGNYQNANRKFTITALSLPSTCVTLGEFTGSSDIKGINYIDQPQASADQIVQQYGYIIRKSSNTVIVEFQSAFTNATSKSMVINFEGVVIHPNF